MTLPKRAPAGSLVMEIPLFDEGSAELKRLTALPWPRWLRRLVEMESTEDGETNADLDRISLATGLTALSTEIAHRLGLLSFICSRLPELGWTLELADNHIYAFRPMTREAALSQLQEAGVAGALTAVMETDDEGWPRFHTVVEP